MASHDVIFLTNDASTRKKWAKDLFRIVLPAVEFNDLVGTGSDSIIQMRTELAKGEGDQIKFDIRLPFTGEGTVGQDPVEGNEEKMRFRNCYFTVEELNHAIDTGGKMDEQRVPYNLMEEAKSGLQDWWGSKLSDYIMSVLAGDSTYRINSKVFAQANVEPDTGHFMQVNDVAEASMTSADILDLSFLDRMKQRAQMPADGCYKVRPIKIGGKEYFRVILHTFVFDRMRTNINAGQWGDLLRAAQKLNVPQVEFEYNGMLVSKSERVRCTRLVTPSTKTGVYRNVLLGAQAGVFAWGGAGESKSTVMSFTPYTRDAERFVMIRGGGIFGCVKPRFDSHDFGVIVGSSWGEPLT